MRRWNSTIRFLAITGILFVIVGLAACQGSVQTGEPAVLSTGTALSLSEAITSAPPGPALADSGAREINTPPLPTQLSTPPTSTEPVASPGPIAEKTETHETASATAPVQDTGPTASGADKMVALAVTDLAGRLVVAERDILVASVEEAEWSDAGLDCPQPGMAYAQVITPGYRVLLEVEAQTYEYHTSLNQGVVLCTDLTSSPGAPATSGLPIFVEMLQSPLSPDPVAKMPPKDGNPTGVFAFNQADRSLLVQPSVQILPTTEVLVGVTSASVPNRPYVASELYQIPSSRLAPLSVIAIEAESGALTVDYAGQTFELGPGENRSFKERAEGELSLVEMTTITNHGRLTVLGLLSADPAGP